MNRGLKILLLPSILLIPAAIYIFLQVFGRNEYSLPVYHTVEGMDMLDAGGGPDGEGTIYSHGLSRDGDRVVDQYSLTGSISIIEFITSEDDVHSRNRQIRRIVDMFADESSLQVIRIFEEEGIKDRDEYIVAGDFNMWIYSSSYDGIVRFAAERLGLQIDIRNPKVIDQLVLLDRKGRVRGYYTSTEFEEMDRLVLELKILIKQDQNV